MKCFKCNINLKNEDEIQYGLHKKCFLDWFSLGKVSEFTELFSHAGSDPEISVNHLSKYNSSFFHGKFKKYSASLDENEYILKVEESDYPELPAVEFLCYQIARHLDIIIPDFYYINFHNKKTFVNKNFINKNKRMTLHHFYHFFNENDQFDCKTIRKTADALMSCMHSAVYPCAIVLILLPRVPSHRDIYIGIYIRIR